MADSNTPLAVRVGQFGDCGCVLEGREVGLGLKQCPTHAAAPEMEALLRDLLSAVTEMYEDGIIRADSLTPAFLSAERHATALLSSLDQEKP